MARTAVAKNRKKSSFFGYVLVSFVIMLIAGVMFLQGGRVRSKLNTYIAQEQVLDEQIAQQNKRTEEIAEFEKYVQTKAYAGEQAQEKLGLVNEGEIVFRKK